MIELIESKEQLEQWTKRDIYSIRVLSLLESYGTRYHFAMFYRQIIDGRITFFYAIMCANLCRLSIKIC